MGSLIYTESHSLSGPSKKLGIHFPIACSQVSWTCPPWLWVTLFSAAKAGIYLYEVVPFRQIPEADRPAPAPVRSSHPRFSDTWYLTSPRYCPGRGRCPSESFRSVHRVSVSPSTAFFLHWESFNGPSEPTYWSIALVRRSVLWVLVGFTAFSRP